MAKNKTALILGFIYLVQKTIESSNISHLGVITHKHDNNKQLEYQW